MPRVSRVRIARDIYNDLNDSFVDLISTLKDKSEIKRFLGDFLTKEEKLMLSKRLVLALMIYQGYSTNDIQESLKVSRTTINFMRRWISNKRGINVGVEKLVSTEGRKKSGDKIEDIFKHLPPLTRSKKDMAKWLNR